MSKLNDQLKEISRGLTPGLVKFKSQEYAVEFEGLMEDKEEEMGEVPDEEMMFRSFICHKVAALDLTLNHILEILGNEE